MVYPLIRTIEFRGTHSEAQKAYNSILMRLGSTDAQLVDSFVSIHKQHRIPFTGLAIFRFCQYFEFTVSVGPIDNATSLSVQHYVVALTLIRPLKLFTKGHQAAERLYKLIDRLSFTDSEVKSIYSQMPLTRSIPQYYQSKPLSKLSVIFAIHHMTDFLAVMKSALDLGLAPEVVTVIDKQYQYLYSSRVDAHLVERFGVTVCRYNNIEDGIAKHIECARRADKKILVLDDGGYIFPILHKSFPADLQHFIGLVEQTVSGIWRINDLINEFTVPIFSVAESEVKKTIESYGIADVAVRRTLALLPNEKFEGQTALVIGYGRIGEQVADILRNRRLQVIVYDRSLTRLIAARERGFVVGPDLPTLIKHYRPLLIVGCAGSNSMTTRDFKAIRSRCYLVSTTSRDYEFNLSDLNALAASVEDHGSLGSVYLLDNHVQVVVIANGYPVNFHYAESLPNRYADLILASVLIGACTLAENSNKFRKGNNVALTNEILDNAPLLTDYFRLFDNDTREA